MNRIQIIILVITSIALGSSCTKEIEFNAKLLEPKLVVNALCNLDSIMEVEVSANKPIPGFETDFPFISDATVKLFVDGTETEQLAYQAQIEYANQSAVYVGKTIVETGKHYKLEVSHKDFKKTAMAEMQMGAKIPILNISTTTIANTDINSWTSQKIKATMKFKDPVDEENFYRLNIGYRIGKNYTYSNENGDTINHVTVMDYNFSYGGIESDDPVLSSNNNADEILFETSSSRYTVFTDELFNGKTYDLTFYLSEYVLYDIQNLDTTKGDFYIVNFELQSLTRDAYYYIKSVGTSDGNGGLFTEPVQVYNNINNGIGIFGGISTSLYTLHKGEYPIEGVDYSYGSASY
jgi:hypothetical protein